MSVAVSAVVAVPRFLYHYIVGDDLAVAMVIVLALAGTGILVANGINAWWLVPLLAVVMTGVSLWRRGVSVGEPESPPPGDAGSPRRA